MRFGNVDKIETDEINAIYLRLGVMTHSHCPGCGVELPAFDGPVHRYMESSPACWAKYGELLARQYTDPSYRAAQRLATDTYAVQHPGHPSPQSIQSVGGHLVSLQVMLEAGESVDYATRLMRRCLEQQPFIWLDPPARLARYNVLHPLAARSAAAHLQAVHEWAQSVWEVWSEHHAQVRAWAAQARSDDA